MKAIIRNWDWLPFVLWAAFMLLLLLGASGTARCAEYVNGAVLLLDANKGMSVTNSGTGGGGYTLPFYGTSGQRMKVWLNRVNVPTRGSQSSCSDPCSASINLNYGVTYLWFEVVDSSGNPLSPAHLGTRITIPTVTGPTVICCTSLMPREVMSGSDGYVLTDQINVPSGSATTGLRLYIQGDNLGYRIGLGNPAVYDGKGSYSINGGAWVPISNANFPQALDDYAPWGGIGGGPQNLQLATSNVVSVNTGTNTIAWRFNQTDGVTSGYRLDAFNFLEPDIALTSITVSSNVATVLCAATCSYTTGNWILIHQAPGPHGGALNGPQQITAVDSTHFTFAVTYPNGTYAPPTSNTPTGVPATLQPVMYAARQIIPQTSFSLAAQPNSTAPVGSDPVAGQACWFNTGGVCPIFLPSTPYFNYTSGASCGNCHASFLTAAEPGDGGDLKYFAFSNTAIIARSRFHAISDQQSANIAAYIRGLAITVPANAAPENPPYQPGPGLDAAGANAFSAGAGLSAVYMYDTDREKDMFPSGSGSGLRAAAVPSFNLHNSSVPFSFMPWNMWLPMFWPGDFDSGFTSRSLYTYFTGALSGITPGSASSCDSYEDDNCLASWGSQIRNYSSCAIGSNCIGPDSAAFPLTIAGSASPALAGQFAASKFQWGAKAQWQMVHSLNVEAQLGAVYVLNFGSSPVQSSYITSGWQGVMPFDFTPHFNDIQPVTLLNGSTLTYNYITHVQYIASTVINNGNQFNCNQCESDLSYALGFIADYNGSRPIGFTSFLYELAAVQGSWGWTVAGPHNNASVVCCFNWNSCCLAQGYFAPGGDTANMLAWLSTGQKAELATALANSIADTLAAFTPTQWAAGNTLTCTTPTAGGSSGTFADNLAYLMPILKFLGGDSTVLGNAATSATSIFTGCSYNWTTELNSTCANKIGATPPYPVCNNTAFYP